MKTITTLAMAAALLWPAGAMALSMEEAVAEALKNNHAVKRAAHEHTAARRDLMATRSVLLPGIETSYTYMRSSESVYSGSDEASVATVTASYNIFAGFADFNNIRRAGALARAAEYSMDAAREDMVLEAKTAYTGVLKADIARVTAQEGLTLLESQRKDAELYFREGLIAKNDLLKVEVELATVRQRLIEAEGGYRIAVKMLERTIGRPLAADETLEPLLESEAVEGLDFESLKRRMLKNRSELKYLRETVRSLNLTTAMARSVLMPRVDVSVSHSLYGDSFTVGGRTSDHDSDTVGMVTASWKIFDGFGATSMQSSLKYQARAAQEGLKDMESQLLLGLSIAMEEHEVARAKLEVARTAVSQAEENYRVTELQFKERVATTTDLLDARASLTGAKDSCNSARFDLMLALARIERIVEGPVRPQ